jgi:hypothetical protein
MADGGLIIGALSIHYDRGVARKKARDLGLTRIPKYTPDGEEIRGGGSHWREGLKDIVRERDNDAERIRTAFGRAFMAAPFKGTYVLPDRGAGQRFLDTLEPRPRADVTVTVSEYVLTVVAQTPQDVSDWSDRVTRQLQKVPLGRGKQAGIDGLQVLPSGSLIAPARMTRLIWTNGRSCFSISMTFNPLDRADSQRCRSR